MHAAEQRKERESLEEAIHSIQLESELTSRALKQTVSVSIPQPHCFTALTSSAAAISSLLFALCPCPASLFSFHSVLQRTFSLSGCDVR